jgi:tRNA A37 threonylcarbamoyladenosine dehydratase
LDYDQLTSTTTVAADPGVCPTVKTKDYSQFTRTEILIGSEALSKLHFARVAVIGLGGVGSYAAEALARAGIGKFLLIDFDVVNLSNLNRQLLALHSSLDQPKTELLRQRILDINPDADVEICNTFLAQENRAAILGKPAVIQGNSGAFAESVIPAQAEIQNSEPQSDTQPLDYILDAIDSLGPKIGLIEYAIKNGFRIISVMGAGNRLDPSQIQISTLSKSWNCPLAKRVRKFLRRRGVTTDYPVIFSSETPIKPIEDEETEADEIIIHRGRERKIIGSISYMPAILGMMAASVVIRDLIEP